MPDVIASEGASSPRARPRPRSVDAILWGGAVAGTLDILCAIVLTVLHGGSPIRMLQSIASGLLGRASYDGGLLTAGLGLALHFFIATTATTVYVAASHRWPVLRQRPVPCGVAYGVVVYAFMTYAVLPIAFGSFPVFSWTTLAQGLIVHILAVGLPIALLTRRALGDK